MVNGMFSLTIWLIRSMRSGLCLIMDWASINLLLVLMGLEDWNSSCYDKILGLGHIKDKIIFLYLDPCRFGSWLFNFRAGFRIRPLLFMFPKRFPWDAICSPEGMSNNPSRKHITRNCTSFYITNKACTLVSKLYKLHLQNYYKLLNSYNTTNKR